MQPSNEGTPEPSEEGGWSRKHTIGLIVFVLIVLAVGGVISTLYSSYQHQQATQRISITPYQYLTADSLLERKINFLVRFDNPSDLSVQVVGGEVFVTIDNIPLGRAIETGFSISAKRSVSRQYEFSISMSDLTIMTDKGDGSLEALITGSFRLISENQEFVNQFSFTGQVDVNPGNTEAGLG